MRKILFLICLALFAFNQIASAEADGQIIYNTTVTVKGGDDPIPPSFPPTIPPKTMFTSMAQVQYSQTTVTVSTTLQNVIVIIYDINGNIVYQTTMTSNCISIDASDWNVGDYSVVLKIE